MSQRADPLVSIVVPTFNAERHLRETLDSVLAQTLQDFELIVVDDDSTDRTTALVRGNYPAALLVEQANAGVCAARNHGLALARGRYICFLDQDDVWFAQKLMRQVECLEREPALAAVACPYVFWHPDSDGGAGLRSLPPDPGMQLVAGFEGWTYHQFLLDCWALTSATMLRTAIVRECGGFDTAQPYAEDWDLWLRISRRRPFALLSWPPVLYRQHAVQGSRAIRRADYRCELLTRAARAHGLASPDGQSISAAQFRAQIARYRMEFGYHHLQYGDRWVGVCSLLRAWALQPARWRALALAGLGVLGRRPARTM